MEVNRNRSTSSTATAPRSQAPARSQAASRAQAPARTAPRQENPAQRDRVTVSQPEQQRGQQMQTPNFWSSFGSGETAARNRNTPMQYRGDNAQKLQESGVPAELSNHPGGPPAAPESRFRADELNADGTPRTGAIFNRIGAYEGNSRHHYVHIGALEPGLTREQAIEVANGFNAPTSDAMRGYPNSMETREGWVDPTAPAGGGMVAGPFGYAGGHVSMNRGTTPDGLPWAINSTTEGWHPLNGHITRSLIEHEGRYYIRTEGIGTGDSSLLSHGQDALNALVGPSTFDQLNEAGNRWARWKHELGTEEQRSRDRVWEGTQTALRGPLGLLEDAWRGIFG